MGRIGAASLLSTSRRRLPSARHDIFSLSASFRSISPRVRYSTSRTKRSPPCRWAPLPSSSSSSCAAPGWTSAATARCACRHRPSNDLGGEPRAAGRVGTLNAGHRCRNTDSVTLASPVMRNAAPDHAGAERNLDRPDDQGCLEGTIGSRHRTRERRELLLRRRAYGRPGRLPGLESPDRHAQPAR